MEQTSNKMMKGVHLKIDNIQYVKDLAEKESRNFSNMLDMVIERYRDSLNRLRGES